MSSYRNMLSLLTGGRLIMPTNLRGGNRTMKWSLGKEPSKPAAKKRFIIISFRKLQEIPHLKREIIEICEYSGKISQDPTQ